MQGVTGEWLQPCNSNPVRDAETQTAAGDPPGMEDNEKTELFWRKRNMTAEGCPQIPASVLSRCSFPDSKGNTVTAERKIVCIARHWHPEEDRLL